MNKRDTIAAIGQKTRMRNHDVQTVVEALLELWTEELVNGGRIEIQNFLVLQLQTTRRKGNLGTLRSNGQEVRIPRVRREIKVWASKYLKQRIRGKPR
jgi:nucleoid DNA-binding protein